MRKARLIVAGATALFAAAPASSQSSAIADAIGQAVYNANRPGSGFPPQCFDGRMHATSQAIATGQEQSEQALQLYLSSARENYDHANVFVQDPKMRHLTIDGAAQDLTRVWDPWAKQITRVERIGFTTSNSGTEYHAEWRAYGAAGQLIGTYDGYLVTWGKKAGSRFFDLNLISPTATVQPRPMTPFCYKPGDIEVWQEAKAKREAEKAARHAKG